MCGAWYAPTWSVYRVCHIHSARYWPDWWQDAQVCFRTSGPEKLGQQWSTRSRVKINSVVKAPNPPGTETRGGGVPPPPPPPPPPTACYIIFFVRK
jgi:hypothetical protein